MSLGKALAIAAPLAASSPGDADALRALALVQQSRSEILWQTDATPQAVPVMREALKSFDALAANPRASVLTICEVSSAYGTLGDELGQNGTASLGDSAGAMSAFRKSIELDVRALGIDPHLVRAQRGLAINRLKIGGIEVETDPAEAFKDFEAALSSLDEMPVSERGSLTWVRLRGMMLRKEAIALDRLGENARAAPFFELARETFRRLSAQDPKICARYTTR